MLRPRALGTAPADPMAHGPCLGPFTHETQDRPPVVDRLLNTSTCFLGVRYRCMTNRPQEVVAAISGLVDVRFSTTPV
jgi:hypothetical protein